MSSYCHITLFLQVKKHIKQGQGHEGGIFSVEAPLHVSNVQVLDPVTGYGCIPDFKCDLIFSFTYFSMNCESMIDVNYAGSLVRLEPDI